MSFIKGCINNVYTKFININVINPTIPHKMNVASCGLTKLNTLDGDSASTGWFDVSPKKLKFSTPISFAAKSIV
jgi:hypothetical protein